MIMAYLSQNGIGREEREDGEVSGDVTMNQVQLGLEQRAHMVQNFRQYFLQCSLLTAVVNLLTNLLQKLHTFSWPSKKKKKKKMHIMHAGKACNTSPSFPGPAHSIIYRQSDQNPHLLSTTISFPSHSKQHNAWQSIQ